MSNRIRRAPWRDAATWLCASVLAVATLSVLLDGGRPAFAADECQYGPYGPYGPYAQYGPYGQPCAKARPTLTILAPGSAAVGTTITPLCASRTAIALQVLSSFACTGRVRGARTPPSRRSGSVRSRLRATASTQPRGSCHHRLTPWGGGRGLPRRRRCSNELTSTVCGVYTTEVTRRVSGTSSTRRPPCRWELPQLSRAARCSSGPRS